MKKFLSKIFIYGLLYFVLANFIALTCKYFLKRSNFFKPSFIVNEFKEGKHFDYLILGSSRGLTTLDSKQIDSTLNTSGINLSMDDTDSKSHHLMLQHFYASGFKAKFCILTLDHSNFKKSRKYISDNDYKFSTYIDRPYIRAHFKTYEPPLFKPISISRYIPFFAYAYYNLQLIPASVYAMLKSKKRYHFDESGNFSYPSINGIDAKNLELKSIIETPISNPIIEQIEALTQKNNTQLILYIAPYPNLEFPNLKQDFIINHATIIDSPSLFYDKLHVNVNGRKIATEYFCKNFSNLLDR